MTQNKDRGVLLRMPLAMYQQLMSLSSSTGRTFADLARSLLETGLAAPSLQEITAERDALRRENEQLRQRVRSLLQRAQGQDGRKPTRITPTNAPLAVQGRAVRPFSSGAPQETSLLAAPAPLLATPRGQTSPVVSLADARRAFADENSTEQEGAREFSAEGGAARGAGATENAAPNAPRPFSPKIAPNPPPLSREEQDRAFIAAQTRLEELRRQRTHTRPSEGPSLEELHRLREIELAVPVVATELVSRRKSLPARRRERQELVAFGRANGVAYEEVESVARALDRQLGRDEEF